MKTKRKKRIKNNRKVNRWKIFAILAAIFIVVVGCIVFALQNGYKGVMGTSSTISYPPLPISSWLWDSPTKFSTESATFLIQNARQHDVSTIYISLDEYLAITEISDPNIKATRLNQFNNSLTNFITIANINNITVQGLTGNPKWIDSMYSYIPPLFLNYVIGFNKAHAGVARIDGLQFDIEFYSLYFSTDDFNAAAKRYLNLVNNLIGQLKNNRDSSALKVGFATPFWFDNSTYTFTYNKKHQVLAYHLLNLLNTYPNSYIAIMDYRNYTGGSDGSVSLAQNELAYAQKNAKNVGIYIGQETKNVQPAKITFYGLSKTTLITAISEIYNYYKQNDTLKGFAIHDLMRYLALQ